MKNISEYVELASQGKLTSWEAFSEENPLSKIYCFSVSENDPDALTIRKEELFYVVEISPNVEIPPYLTTVISITKEDEEKIYNAFDFLFNWALINAKQLPNRKERVLDYIEYLQEELDNI